MYRAKRARGGWVAVRWDGRAWEILADDLPSSADAIAVCSDHLAADLGLAPPVEDISF